MGDDELIAGTARGDADASAARGDADGSAALYRRRLGNGVVAVSAAVTVTVAVVVLALAPVGHGQKAAHTSPPGSSRPIATPHKVRRVLAGNGIATVKFGQSRVAVIAALTPLLGPTSSGYTRVQAECGVDHTVTWPDWPPVSAHGAHDQLAPVLTTFFWHSRFVGYQYGEFGTNAAPRAPSKGTVLATARGLTIGNKLARGRRLYGGAFEISAAQGGSFAISTPNGRLTGYAWVAPQAPSVLSPTNLVATLDAGDVGCPAVSP